jgi:hypothetical protein
LVALPRAGHHVDAGELVGWRADGQIEVNTCSFGGGTILTGHKGLPVSQIRDAHVMEAEGELGRTLPPTPVVAEARESP